MEPDAGEVLPGIVDDLGRIGVEMGDFLVVHSSFKSIGLSGGRPCDVVRTLVECVGESGTVMAPTFTYSYSGIWGAVPFDRDTTPGRNMGAISEALRGYPSARRSDHPAYSVVAIGKYADDVTRDKGSASALGIGSSYDDAHRLGAKIVLIGVGNNRNSMVHYAEAVSGLPYNDIPFREFWGQSALAKRGGEVVEVALVGECPGCSASFGVADEYLDSQGVVTRGMIGQADSMLMDARAMVAAIVERLRREPDWLLCDSIVCEPCNLRRRRLREQGLI